MFILKELDKLENDNFESEKELLKIALKNYKKDMEQKNEVLAGTTALLITIVAVFIYSIFK